MERSKADESRIISANTAPALDSVEYEFIKFQGALDAENRFKGAPNDDLDQAWDDLVNSQYHIPPNCLPPDLLFF